MTGAEKLTRFGDELLRKLLPSYPLQGVLMEIDEDLISLIELFPSSIPDITEWNSIKRRYFEARYFESLRKDQDEANWERLTEGGVSNYKFPIDCSEDIFDAAIFTATQFLYPEDCVTMRAPGYYHDEYVEFESSEEYEMWTKSGEFYATQGDYDYYLLRVARRIYDVTLEAVYEDYNCIAVGLPPYDPYFMDLVFSSPDDFTLAKIRFS